MIALILSLKMKLAEFIKDRTLEIVFVLVGLILLMIISIVCYMVLLLKDKNPVVSVAQSQIETSAGVKAAAGNAGYDLTSDQSKQIAHSVKEISENSSEPDYVVYSSGTTAELDAEKARLDNKADFALITSPSEPDKSVDLSKLDEKTTVNLNQYNIQAYKKVIRQVSYGKNLANGADIIGAAVSRKISKNGKYLGIGVDQELGDNHATMLKVIYSW